MRGRVKCATMHSLAIAPDQSLGARQHFLRCASRECEKQNPIGSDTPLDEVRDTVYESSSLPGSSPRDDEERSISVRRGCGLLRIQLRCKIAGRPGRFRA